MYTKSWFSEKAGEKQLTSIPLPETRSMTWLGQVIEIYSPKERRVHDTLVGNHVFFRHSFNDTSDRAKNLSQKRGSPGMKGPGVSTSFAE